MDLVRYILSLAVIVAHFNTIMDADIPFPISSGTAVGVFFGLSGYLVYGSFLKHPDFKKYVGNRMRRILPPYLFIVFLCAFGLSAVSTLPIREYFLSPDFWKYLLSNICFLNFLHPDLPGVFTGMDITAVDGSLWTLKVEWLLYLSIPLFFWCIRRYKWNVPVVIVALCICSVLYNKMMLYIADITQNDMFRIMSYQFVGQLSYFYTGVLIYHFKDKLANKRWTAVLPVAFIGYLLFETNICNADNTLFDILAPIVLTFVTVWFSISRVISPYISIVGNVSYEMYLFHFPIIQLGCYLQLSQYVPKHFYFALVLFSIIVLSVVFHQLWKRSNKNK